MSLYETTWDHDRLLELRNDAEEGMDEDEGSCCSGILEEE